MATNLPNRPWTVSTFIFPRLTWSEELQGAQYNAGDNLKKEIYCHDGRVFHKIRSRFSVTALHDLYSEGILSLVDQKCCVNSLFFPLQLYQVTTTRDCMALQEHVVG